MKLGKSQWLPAQEIESISNIPAKKKKKEQNNHQKISHLSYNHPIIPYPVPVSHGNAFHDSVLIQYRANRSLPI